MVISGSKQPPRYKLRNLVLSNGGVMDIVPDVVKSKTFKGWEKRDICAFVYQLRREYTDGEVWAIYKNTIYAREKDMPPEIWKRICDRRTRKVSGVAEQNRIYDEKYKKHRPETEAQKSLDSHIQVLGETIDSSYKLIKKLSELESSDEVQRSFE